MSLKTIIDSFEKDLEEKVKARDDVVAICRKLITLSKQAVMAVHRDELGKARGKLIEAKKMLGQVDEILLSHRDVSVNIARVARQEYAEAEILLRLVETEKFPGPGELGVPEIPYLLGLADSIGEFRRRALESLRRRNLEVAERSLQIMDEIYSELIVLENISSLAPELRRKCDVARRIIEVTIGDIATETGRSSLERSIEHLEKLIKNTKSYYSG